MPNEIPDAYVLSSVHVLHSNRKEYYDFDANKYNVVLFFLISIEKLLTRSNVCS